MRAAEPPADNLFGLTHDELERLALAAAQRPYRGRQIFRAIYGRGERDFNAVTDLDREFRSRLSARYRVAYPEIQREFASSDGAVRYLLRLEDGESIEAVYIPEPHRRTLCLSSQVGCALDCRFCFTAFVGMKRNLTAGEILGQVYALATARRIPRKTNLNVVFMGMGEPLFNLAPVMKAVGIMAHREGLAIPLRRITISTSGIIPPILELARDPMRPKLAVSLNASTEDQRTALMPINRKYPLCELLRVCRQYPLRPRERLTFEYVLLDGTNDSDQDAARVAAMLQGIRAKVNLIPYNSGPELPYRPSPLPRVLAFQAVLTRRRIPAFIRISRGQDVRAACGQLRLEGLLDEARPVTTP